jgi:oxygen-dependent protoporphyrinogen oxidase
MRLVVIGGGIAGLAAARRLEALVPDAEIVLVERSERLGGKLLTEHVDGFVIEGSADSFLSRKPRGIGLCEEIGLASEVIARRPEHARSFVRHGNELHPLPEGLTGLIPTNLDALAASPLLSEEGKARLAAEPDIPSAAPGGDESIASFISRRLGSEAYEAFVEPLLTGIYGGDGDHLSLEATFPQLRQLELEHGSILRGLRAQSPSESVLPPFLSLRDGLGDLVTALMRQLERTSVRARSVARSVRRDGDGYQIEVDDGALKADGLVVAVPAFAAAELLADLDAELADWHGEIRYASSVVVSLAYDRSGVEHPLDAYGYVVPRAEQSDVLACTWTSSKWAGRAPEGKVLIRVLAGRVDARDVTVDDDDSLIALARTEVRVLGIESEPALTRIHRWRDGMPQYVLGHPERIERIEQRVEEHPGIALAGAAYRGVGIPDCIASGEQAAESIARSLARVVG